MFDIITVGSATVDAFAHTDNSELIKILSPSEEHSLLAYPAGSKILINELNFTTGGGGTNTAVGFSRMGLKTAFVGKLGSDDNAVFIRKILKRDKVKDLSLTGKELTGYSMVLDSIEHDRTILIHRGANNNLSFKEIKKSQLKTKWFYFSTMMDESFLTLEKLAEFAVKKNIKIAMNISEYLAKKGSFHLRNILKHVDILILNDTEAGLLTNKDNHDDMLRALHGLGPKIVALTLGKEGVLTCDQHHKCRIHPIKTKILETTGAGDAFAVGFVTGLIKGKDMQTAVKLGQINAESVIQHHGAKNNLLTWNNALAKIKKQKHKIKISKL